MKKSLTKFVILSLSLLFFVGCKQKKEDVVTHHSTYNSNITAFTSGVISTTDKVVIEFKDPITDKSMQQRIVKSYLDVEPKLSGQWNWDNDRVVYFTSSQKLPYGQKWKFSIRTSKVYKDSDDFFFEVSTLPQNYRINYFPIESTSDKGERFYTVRGNVEVTHSITKSDAEKLLKAYINSQAVAVEWQSPEGNNIGFVVKNIRRTEKSQELIINYDGKHIGSDSKGTNKIEIPAVGKFLVHNVESVSEPRQMIKVIFSDELDPQQNIDGLIELSHNLEFKYLKKGNIIEIYPQKKLSGKVETIIHNGIKDKFGNELENGNYRASISFTISKPEVEILGKGLILPESNQTLIHFKATGLKAVIVRVIKVFEDNIPFFLQTNELDGSSELKRAGKLIHQEVVNLDTDKSLDLNQWNSFAVDLKEMIKTDPGSIYRVEIAFTIACSTYPCSDKDKKTENEMIDILDDGDYWDNPYNYWGSGPYDSYWDWQNRDNPCSQAYYTRSRYASCNIIASSIGIIAKTNNSNDWWFYLSNIETTEPIRNGQISLLNFQLQEIATTQTDSEGKANINVDGYPFLAVVKSGKMKGYLRLHPSEMLSVSKFDVSGQTIKDGLKGYIYGERGVWRPGDSIYISMMLEDKLNQLPKNHPVVFEFFNPKGLLIDSKTSTHPENRVFTFGTKTDEEAETGMYRVKATVGNSIFAHNIRIETVKPNRLKINLNLPETIYSSDSKHFKLNSEWLHGASAANLKADIELTATSARTTFEKFHNYKFTDSTKDFDGYDESVFKANLSQNGEGNFNLKLNFAETPPGKLSLEFTTRVFEESGAYSIVSDKTIYSPFSSYVGISMPDEMKEEYLLTDKEHKLNVVMLSEKGVLGGSANLQYTLYKLNWRWWWDNSSENLGRYLRSRSSNRIKDGIVKVVNGRGEVPIKIKEKDWGRYLLRIENRASGHSSTITFWADSPGWMSRDAGSDAAKMLVLSSDKDKYEVGETATISFPSAKGGRALVTIENGTTIVNSWWVNTDSEKTKYSFKVTDDMTPNVYVSVSMLQPYKDKENDLPIRLYGIQPISVYSSETILKPKIQTKDEWAPLEKAQLTISEENKQNMTYTIAIVDEGLLDLTRFATPDPWSNFNKKEALGIKSWDIYDYVLGAYGGKIEKMFTIGGDDEGLSDDARNKINPFAPVVKFMGPYNLRKGGKNKHNVEMPNYIGAVRVMVIATNNFAHGSTDKSVKVIKPLMIKSNVPPLLGINEEIDIPVTIFSNEKSTVTVKIETDKLASIKGDKSKKVFVNQGESKTLFFRVKASELTGSTNVSISASSSSDKHGELFSIPIINPNPILTTVQKAHLKEKESTSLSFTIDKNSKESNVAVELSRLGYLSVESRVKSIDNCYYYGLEHSVSQAFAHMLFVQMADLTPGQKTNSQQIVKDAIDNIRKMQLADGSFSRWMNYLYSDDWLNNYAGHFLIEAEKLGYFVQPNVKNEWLNYQSKASNSWSPRTVGRYYGEDFMQAYRLYTLALANKPNISAMNRLRQQPNLTWQAKWRLSMAYHISGMKDVGEKLFTESQMDNSSLGSYRSTYGSPERDLAMAIETLVLMNKRDVAMQYVQELAEELEGDKWMSTQSTAYSLLALSKFIGEQNVKSKKAKATIELKKVDKLTVEFDKPVYKYEFKKEMPEKGSVDVKNMTDGELFVNLIVTNQPTTDTITKKESNGIHINVEYQNLSGGKLDPKNIKKGEDFKIVTTVVNKSPKNIEDLALVQRFPSGWQIRNPRMDASVQKYMIDTPKFQDIRDSHINSYFELFYGQTKRFVTVVHSSFAGKFYQPAVVCEDMYNYNNRSTEPGFWIEVID